MKKWFMKPCHHSFVQVVLQYRGCSIISKDPRDMTKNLLGDQIDTVQVVCSNPSCCKILLNDRIVMDHIYKIFWEMPK